MNKRGYHALLLAFVVYGGCGAVALAAENYGAAPSLGTMQVTPKKRHRDQQKRKPINIKIGAPELDLGANVNHIEGLTTFAVHPTRQSQADRPPAEPAQAGHAPVDHAGAGPSIQPLRALKTPPPAYPPDEYQAGTTAEVRLAFTVRADGTTADIKVLTPKAPASFQHAARTAVSRWTFRPYAIDGVAHSKRVQQTFRFSPPAAARHASKPKPKPQSSGRGPALPSESRPVPTHLVPPQYPIKAARRHVNGYVVVAFTVNAAGRTEDIQVVESKPRRVFDAAAREAVQQWRFQPYRIDGKPASTRVQQKIKFDLGGG